MKNGCKAARTELFERYTSHNFETSSAMHYLLLTHSYTLSLSLSSTHIDCNGIKSCPIYGLDYYYREKNGVSEWEATK